MYVCSCEAVTDRTVNAAIAAGARTPADLAGLCSAGSRCGGCWPTLVEMIERVSERDTAVAHSAA